MEHWQRIERLRDGTFALALPPEEQELLRSLPAQLRGLLNDPGADGDDALVRLFPSAYTGDSDASAENAQRNSEYARLVHDDLRDQRLAAAQIVIDTAANTRLDEEQVIAWLGVLNDLRLVIGTRLGLTEETSDEYPPRDDPSFGPYLAYRYLTDLQIMVLAALTGEEL